MSESFTKPFTKAEIAAMRRLGEREAERETEGGEHGLQRKFWAKVKRVAKRIPFAEDLLAAYFCTLDPVTPNRVRLVLLGAIAYFVMPFDLVPDILPVIGFADDAAFVMAAIAQVAGSINESHREQAREALRDQGGG
jgi:uncharacterized membrane protein YkvA (DUF1232 family)